MQFIYLIFIPFLLFADVCWWNIPSLQSGGTWSSCHKCNGKSMCGPQQWGCEPHTCGNGKVWTYLHGACSCRQEDFCPSYMKRDQTGHCIPNPDMSKAECAKQGGTYVDCSSFASLISLNNVVACIGGSGCYSPTWVQSKINSLKSRFKNIFTPTHVLTSALSLLPISKIFKLPGMIDNLINSIKETGGNLKMLEDNKPLIDLKYNPDTGTYEPEIMYTPRQKPLTPENLLVPPKTPEDAKNIIDTAPNLKDFEESPFADIKPKNMDELRNEMIGNDLESPQVRTKIAEDLREIFKRSEPKSDTNLPVPIQKPSEEVLNTPVTFPMIIPDSTAPGGHIQTQVKRKVKYLGGNQYDVMYVIKPQGASKPTVVHYYVTLTPDHAQVVPKYKINDTNYVTGRSGDLYSSKIPFANPGLPVPSASPNAQSSTSVVNNYYYYNTTNNYNSEENNTSLPDVTTAEAPIEKEIAKALDYKIVLFRCPKVTPHCPNDLNVSMFGGTLTIPSPICAVITAMNNPKISPKIDWAGNIIVIVATIAGLLTLFKRN